MLGAVADEAHSPILLPIAGIHHVHVQPSNACAQGVVRCVAAAALDLGSHSLPTVMPDEHWQSGHICHHDEMSSRVDHWTSTYRPGSLLEHCVGTG